MLFQQREQLAIEDWLAEDWLCPRLVLSSNVTAGSRPVRFRNQGFFLSFFFPSKRHKLMSPSAEMKCGNDYLLNRGGGALKHRTITTVASHFQ